MKTVFLATVAAVVLSGSAFALGGVNGTSLNLAGVNGTSFNLSGEWLGVEFSAVVDLNSLRLLAQRSGIDRLSDICSARPHRCGRCTRLC